MDWMLAGRACGNPVKTMSSQYRWQMGQAKQPAIRLCGLFDVTLDGQRVTQSLPGRQGRLLAAYLACNRGRSVTRDELIDLLWPSTPPTNPRDVLGALLSKLRRALGASVLQGRREVLLVLPADTSIDLELAEEAIQEAEAGLVAGAGRLALDQARAGGELLAGEFLPGHAGPWVEQRRRDVEALRLRALECVARAGLGLDGAQLASAETAARGLINAEPLRERGYRLLMDVLAARGDISAALQTYEQLRVRLRDELGVVPGAAIRARHERLLTGGDVADTNADERSEQNAAGVSREAPSRQTAERRRIAASKLSPPLLRPGIVDRPSLIESLLAAAQATAVVASAPAGYGKTTLLALWRARDDRPFAWVSLDAGDNDPVAFLGAVIDALDPVLGLDDAIGEALAVPEPPLEEFVLPSLVNACADAERDFVLVLDDLHLVTDRRSQAVVEYLARRLPAGCQLALATRIEPTLPLASLRAHGRLAEVRAAELSLRDSEARELLDAAGVHLTHDRVAELVERTEGWPAGIYLAAMSLRNRHQPEEFVDQFTGTSRHVADFLAEDVLARQPDELIDFLLRTCVLDELTGSLCDAVTGRNGADATLRELERINLFVVPLDEERLAYRYHHLLAQYLRTQLARREPELARELHRRAWRWYRDHDLIGRAVTHAQAAGDVDVAAELVAAGWLATSERGQGETLRSWLAGFSDAQIEAHAPLAIAAAWVTALAGEGERAARFADAARRGSWDGPMPDGSASLESALAIMSSAFGLGGLSSMRAAAQRAVDLEPATSPWRPLALMLLGIARTLEGDFANARDVLDEAVQLTGGETPISAVSLAYLAVIAIQGCDDEAAWRHAQRSHAIVERPGLRNYLPSVCTYGVVANLLSRRDDPERAAIATERANELLTQLTEAYWWQMIETRIKLAPALTLLGRQDEAATRLKEAAALLAGRDDTGILPDWHAEASRQLHDHRSQRPERLNHTEPADSAPDRDEHDAARDPARIVPLRAAAD
jgi:LuxR family transcriptional regulator, maltose regulon positive regulatory protein